MEEQIERLKKQAVELKKAGKINEAVAALRQFKALEAQLAKNNAAQAAKDLFAAAVKGDIATAQVALAKGANVNAQSEGGYTALHAACRNGHIQVVKILLDSHADPRIDTDFNKDARQIAEKQGHKAIVDLLAPLCPEKEPKQPAEDDIAEVIRRAMAEAEIEVAREDAEAGGDPNDPTKRFEADHMFQFQDADGEDEAKPAPAKSAAKQTVKPAAVAAKPTETEEIICIPEGEGKLGLSLGLAESNTVVFVKALNRGSEGQSLRAEAAGFQVGDVLNTVNAVAVTALTVADQLAKASFPLIVAVTRKR